MFICETISRSESRLSETLKIESSTSDDRDRLRYQRAPSSINCNLQPCVSEELFVSGGGDKDHRSSRMTLVGFCVFLFRHSFFFWFKPYMNRDVASPPPPSGLRSLLAVCVPLMHSHSLACSCKTSRDLSKFPPLQTFRLILCVFFLFLSLFVSAPFPDRTNPPPKASIRHAPTDVLCSSREKHTTSLITIWFRIAFVSLFLSLIRFFTRNSITPFAKLTSTYRFPHDQLNLISRRSFIHSQRWVGTRVGTSDWWWFDAGEMTIDAKETQSGDIYKTKNVGSSLLYALTAVRSTVIHDVVGQ